MPWCPNCKTEYQEGFSVCKDCKATLVEELEKEIELVAFVQSDNKKIADKLVRYFKYSGLEAEYKYDEDNEMYLVYIPAEQEKEAKKLYQAFYFVERENLAKGIIEDDASDSDEISDDSKKSDDLIKSEEAMKSEESIKSDAEENSEAEDEADAAYFADKDSDFVYDEFTEENPDEDVSKTADNEAAYEDDSEEEEDATTYVMKADQYKDLAGTVWVFLAFGIIGIIVVILNVVGILSFLNGFIPTAVMGALFLLFIYIALSTNQKAKKIQVEIDAENKLTGEINQWLEQNVTQSFLESIYIDTMSNELNYLKLLHTVKELLIKQFGPQNKAYLDRLIEEYYNRTFDVE